MDGSTKQTNITIILVFFHLEYKFKKKKTNSLITMHNATENTGIKCIHAFER